MMDQIFPHQECVLLVHGLWASPLDMLGLARFLRRAGYRVYNFCYASMCADINTHVCRLHRYILKHHLDKAPALHVIGHSMGGLILRRTLNAYEFKGLRSFIMLGTPNGGSEWVSAWRKNSGRRAVFDLIYGPAGRELDPQSQPKPPTPLPNCPVGVIAGTKSLIPMAGHVLPAPHDGLVSVQSTLSLPTPPTDFLSVHVTHAFIMDHPDARRAILNFMKTNKFSL